MQGVVTIAYPLARGRDLPSMITILVGPTKNVGDFLIVSRALRLIRKHWDENVCVINRFQPFEPHLDEVARSRALVLCGGPAYTANIVPWIYPILEFMDRISVPVVPFGLGWCGTPKFPDDFEFTEVAREFLIEIHKSIPSSSCRDPITKAILGRAGIKNVTMTGCPVWFDENALGMPLRVPSKMKRIVYTPPASPNLWMESLRVLALLRRRFPTAQIYSCFHRGIGRDALTRSGEARAYRTQATLGRLLGARSRDVSSDLSRIGFYRDCDVHIGYRVHGHLDFLSRRQPSVLISEDGRGRSMSHALNCSTLVAGDATMLPSLDRELSKMALGDQSSLAHVPDYLDATYSDVMIPFLRNLREHTA